jgi:hypothetical protein
LLIQTLLPLLDAPLHRVADHDRASVGAIFEAAPSEHQPGHATHDCALCRFMANLGSFTPPLPARQLPPIATVSIAALPERPGVVRTAAATASQPRAPPHRI